MTSLMKLLPRLSSARVVGDLPAEAVRVHTDSRSVASGDVFVALVGERFDAHAFLSQARDDGAVAAIAQHGLAQAGLVGVEVPDTTAALGELSRLWREQFDLPLVAVTGSNGKTTVTQMLASVLAEAVSDDALATKGNLNNHIGVPMTLLRLRDNHRLAVVELGMNHPGEIAYLASLAQPTVAVVNNAQREHLEFMETVEAVARENGSVLSALPASGVAVFPSDDAYTPVWRELAGSRRVLTFSDSDPNADLHVTSAQWHDGAWSVKLATPDGEMSTRLHIAGRHNVRNAAAVAACALAAGVGLEAIAKGLSDFEPVKGRSRAMRLEFGGQSVDLVDDTYNANPDSMLAAVRVLSELPSPRVLVLGDMGEVGDQGAAFHEEVLAAAADQGIEHILCTGDTFGAVLGSAKAANVSHFMTVDGLAEALVLQLKDGMNVRSMLIKGSRYMQMDRVVDAVAGLTALRAAGKEAQHAA
ncbi:UDP-N-acetylmuramoyl-tripeptide--D-alanyl-D-alanine ligase [Hydrogenophaga sp. 5NK40-0174]|uniref:UDP-N-acetylmuramoyl-tripeptide--D-alanyl-D- alanine ligase n=1 Tax=Hydrogenophaga sp. 5NK40-0174 TaxID=3127649 RepID=UPI00310B73E0